MCRYFRGQPIPQASTWNITSSSSSTTSSSSSSTSTTGSSTTTSDVSSALSTSSPSQPASTPTGFITATTTINTAVTPTTLPSGDCTTQTTFCDANFCYTLDTGTGVWSAQLRQGGDPLALNTPDNNFPAPCFPANTFITADGSPEFCTQDYCYVHEISSSGSGLTFGPWMLGSVGSLASLPDNPIVHSFTDGTYRYYYVFNAWITAFANDTAQISSFGPSSYSQNLTTYPTINQITNPGAPGTFATSSQGYWSGYWTWYWTPPHWEWTWVWYDGNGGSWIVSSTSSTSVPPSPSPPSIAPPTYNIGYTDACYTYSYNQTSLKWSYAPLVLVGGTLSCGPALVPEDTSGPTTITSLTTGTWDGFWTWTGYQWIFTWLYHDTTSSNWFANVQNTSSTPHNTALPPTPAQPTAYTGNNLVPPPSSFCDACYCYNYTNPSWTFNVKTGNGAGVTVACGNAVVPTASNTGAATIPAYPRFHADLTGATLQTVAWMGYWYYDSNNNVWVWPWYYFDGQIDSVWHLSATSIQNSNPQSSQPSDLSVTQAPSTFNDFVPPTSMYCSAMDCCFAYDSITTNWLKGSYSSPAVITYGQSSATCVAPPPASGPTNLVNTSTSTASGFYMWNNANNDWVWTWLVYDNSMQMWVVFTPDATVTVAGVSTATPAPISSTLNTSGFIFGTSTSVVSSTSSTSSVTTPGSSTSDTSSSVSSTTDSSTVTTSTSASATPTSPPGSYCDEYFIYDFDGLSWTYTLKPNAPPSSPPASPQIPASDQIAPVIPSPSVAAPSSTPFYCPPNDYYCYVKDWTGTWYLAYVLRTRGATMPQPGTYLSNTYCDSKFCYTRWCGAWIASLANPSAGLPLDSWPWIPSNSIPGFYVLPPGSPIDFGSFVITYFCDEYYCYNYMNSAWSLDKVIPPPVSYCDGFYTYTWTSGGTWSEVPMPGANTTLAVAHTPPAGTPPPILPPDGSSPLNQNGQTSNVICDSNYCYTKDISNKWWLTFVRRVYNGSVQPPPGTYGSTSYCDTYYCYTWWCNVWIVSYRDLNNLPSSTIVPTVPGTIQPPPDVPTNGAIPFTITDSYYGTVITM